MRSNSKARVAAFAAAALVGGLVSTLGMTSASAAAPTGVTVTPASQTVDVGTGATLTATVTGTAAANVNGVFWRLSSSPSNLGQLCPTTGNVVVTCTIPAASVAGTSTYQVFYDLVSAGGNFQTGDPAATATVTSAGSFQNATITPAAAKAATNSSAAYTVKGTDVNGVAASGSVPVTISQTLPTVVGATNPLSFTDPTLPGFPAAAQASTAGSTVSGTNTIYTQTKSVTLVKGAANIGVASSVAGTVSVTPGANTTTTNAGVPATFTVSAGNASATASQANDNNARKLVLSTPTSTQFSNKPVTEVVTLTNSLGDALGGVQVLGRVNTGSANAGATVAPSATTDQFGQATLTYTPTIAGSDSFTAWVEQSNNATNVAGPNAGEPQATGTVTLVAEPNGLLLSHTPAAPTNPLTQPNTQVTYTLTSTDPAPAAAGLTLDFSINTTGSTAGKVFTVTPTSGVTDAAGQVVVTVTDPAPAAGDIIKVNASVHGDATKKDNGLVITYAAATATTLALAPTAQTLGAGAVVTETATLTDQFSAPVSGKVVTFQVAGRNGPATNATSTGSCTTGGTGSCAFTYTDNGPAFTAANQAAQVDTVTAKADTALSTTATIQFLVSATTASLTLAPLATTTGTTADPTATTPVVTPVAITAVPKNSTGELLLNKSVTFNFTGVGTFTDSTGHAIAGNSTTAQTNSLGTARVFVRSTTTGAQIITATSDGITSSPGSVTVTYTNDYVGITPERVLDTRTGLGSLMTVGGATAPVRIAANTNYVFDIAATDLPLGADAYAFNVTAIHPNQVGNLRIGPWNSSSPTPKTSLINYQISKDVANFVVVPNTGGDRFIIYSASSSVSVAIDAVGYYPNPGDGTHKISTVAPTRVVDTRIGLGGGTGPVLANTSRTFQVADVVTAGTTRSVALNVTAIRPNGVGNMRVYANGVATPNASNVNYIPGVDKSAFVIVNLPANGKIDVYSANATANVAIDLFAIYPTTSNLKTVAPVRILNTRVTGSLAANTPMSFQVTGLAGVPADAQDVLVSVTSIHKATSTGLGNLRVYPTGGAVPTISTLNYVSKTSDVANFAIVKLGTGGKLSLYSVDSPIDVAVDVVGYVPAS